MSQRRGATKTKEAVAFLVIGGLAFIVDAVTYNILVFWVNGRGPMFDVPIAAKITAIVLASAVTYLGNRYWTFSARHLPHKWSRYVLFVIFNVIAIGLQLGCLAFSRYVLDLESIVADNISGTLVGQILATLFRFVTYDKIVFAHDPTVGEPSDAKQESEANEALPQRP